MHSRTVRFAHLALIAAVGLAAYSNTLDAPFQWDEEVYIAGAPVVKDLGYFLDTERARGLELYGALKSRYVGYLSFALNYAAGGLDVTGYHLFNIAVHVLSAFLVYALALVAFQTPLLRENALRERAHGIALLAGALFVAHPIQTEAVTYIFQRLASLAALFYLLSLWAYAKSRLCETPARAVVFYAVSLTAAVLAMKTKENAFTLPFAVALFEYTFFVGPLKARALRLAPLLLTLPIIPLTLVGVQDSAGGIVESVVPATRVYEGLSRGDYFFTELRVLVTYLRLLLFPVAQNLDYDYPVFRSLFDPPVLLSFALLASIGLLALYLLYRSRTRERAAALIGFGILWFFVTLSVESSLVPIPVVIGEYRLYLPSVGVFLAAATAAFAGLEALRDRRARRVALVVLGALPIVLSVATYRRNALWESKISMWEDVVGKSPSLVYPRNNLGIAYVEAGRIDDAMRQFEAALAIEPDHATAQSNLGVLYAQRGRLDEAMLAFRAALRSDPELADAQNNLGLVYLAKGAFGEAEQSFRAAMRIDPGYAKAHYNLGVLFERQGRSDEAAAAFRTALRIDPGYAKARLGLEELARQRGE